MLLYSFIVFLPETVLVLPVIEALLCIIPEVYASPHV